MSLFLQLIGFVICVANSQLVRDRRPTIRIPQGYISGTKVYGDSGKITDTYFGIPYAAPPVGNLRFAPPQRHPGWNGTLQAIDYGSHCPQLPLKDGISDNEDCLYLNIWAPENAPRYGPVPVVIIFEGIEFSKSNRVSIPGQDFATEGVIVVTVNYRLNVFGFLCTETQEVRGNFGLIDQYFAMIWIKENINYFGGDSEKVTLLGYSAGAASVVYHMISPRTQGLFQRAIILSGSVLSPWHTPNNQLTASQRIIKLLGCTNSYTKATLQCLRNKSTQEILKAYEEYSESGNFKEMFLPVVDSFLPESDKYLPFEPLTALREGTYFQVPIMTGIAKYASDPQQNQWIELANQGYIQLQQYFEQSKIREVVHRYNFDINNKNEISELIKWRYLSSSQGDVSQLLEQLKAFDFESKIEAPHFIQLNYLVATFVQPIYAYFMDDLGIALNNSDSTITSDLLMLFGPLLYNQIGRRRFNNNEMRYSRQLKQFMTNFVIFGNPTPSNNGKLWRRYMANDYYIENFDTATKSYKDEVKHYRKVTFWTQLLPKIASMKGYASNDPRELHHSPDPAAGFRHAMYTLVGLVVALLALLLVCIILLKRRTKESERHLHMGY